MLKSKFPTPNNMPKYSTPIPKPSTIVANIRLKAHLLLNKSFIDL